MKYKIDLIIILIISIGLAVLMPGFMLESKTIIFKGITEFSITSIMAFIALSLLYFSFKNKKN